MQSKNWYIALILGFLLLTTIFSSIASPLAASGHERDTGYQLVVTQQKAETGYGADMLFTAVLSFPVADAPIDPEQFQFLFNNKSIGSIGYSGQSNGQATFILQYSTTVPLSIGQYMVSATYFVTRLRTTIQSNTVIHTIGKGDIGTMACLFSGAAAAPGQTIKLYVQLGEIPSIPTLGLTELLLSAPQPSIIQPSSLIVRITLPCRCHLLRETILSNAGLMGPICITRRSNLIGYLLSVRVVNRRLCASIQAPRRLCLDIWRRSMLSCRQLLACLLRLGRSSSSTMAFQRI